jgi:hypothetical protein
LAHAEQHQLIARLKQAFAHETCGQRQIVRLAERCDIARRSCANNTSASNNQRDFGCPSSRFFGELERLRNGGSGSISV